MQKVLVKFNEISLKGKNKGTYITRLVKNIKLSSKTQNCNLLNISKKHDRLIITFNDKKNKIEKTLKSVFGIAFFTFVEEIEKKQKILEIKIQEILEILKEKNINEISFKTKRSDKNYPLKSPEINTKLGDIARKLNIKINYKNINNVIHIEISEKIHIYHEKIDGYGGLPIGSSGRMLSLLSGGIDSPVASFSMLRRGSRVDYIHFHNLENNEKAINSKITNFIKKLNNYQHKSTIWVIPYNVYECFTMGKIHPRYEVIFFKYYILQVAQKLALDMKYDALVTGDNLSQVSSQTIDNMKAASLNTSMMVFRPLLTYDKNEIIKIAKEIETFDNSIEKYKDCCSIHSKDQTTIANLEKFKEIISKINMNELIEESLKASKRFKIEGI